MEMRWRREDKQYSNPFLSKGHNRLILIKRDTTLFSISQCCPLGLAHAVSTSVLMEWLRASLISIGLHEVQWKEKRLGRTLTASDTKYFKIELSIGSYQTGIFRNVFNVWEHQTLYTSNVQRRVYCMFVTIVTIFD